MADLVTSLCAGSTLDTKDYIATLGQHCRASSAACIHAEAQTLTGLRSQADRQQPHQLDRAHETDRQLVLLDIALRNQWHTPSPVSTEEFRDIIRLRCSLRPTTFPASKCDGCCGASLTVDRAQPAGGLTHLRHHDGAAERDSLCVRSRSPTFLCLRPTFNPAHRSGHRQYSASTPKAHTPLYRIARRCQLPAVGLWKREVYYKKFTEGHVSEPFD